MSNSNTDESELVNLTALVNRPVIYDIMSALRGPDIDLKIMSDWNLKWIFTARIRSLIGMKVPIVAAVRMNNHFELKELVLAIREVRAQSGMSHYLYHIREALRALSQILHDDLVSQELTALSTLTDMMYRYSDLIRENEASSDVVLNKEKAILVFAQESKLVEEL
jgi:hypothetical protein